MPKRSSVIPRYFSAHDKLLLFLTCRRSAGKMLQVAAGPLLQRTLSAPGLWKPATGLHSMLKTCAASLLQNDHNGFLLVEAR